MYLVSVEDRAEDLGLLHFFAYALSISFVLCGLVCDIQMINVYEILKYVMIRTRDNK